jgi:hypothetical protein
MARSNWCWPCIRDRDARVQAVDEIDGDLVCADCASALRQGQTRPATVGREAPRVAASLEARGYTMPRRPVEIHPDDLPPRQPRGLCHECKTAKATVLKDDVFMCERCATATEKFTERVSPPEPEPEIVIVPGDRCEDCKCCDAMVRVAKQKLCLRCADGEPCETRKPRKKKESEMPRAGTPLTPVQEAEIRNAAPEVSTISLQKKFHVGASRINAMRKGNGAASDAPNGGKPFISLPAPQARPKPARSGRFDHDAIHAGENEQQAINLPITERHLDAFWAKLSPQEKADLFLLQLGAG